MRVLNYFLSFLLTFNGFGLTPSHNSVSVKDFSPRQIKLYEQLRKKYLLSDSNKFHSSSNNVKTEVTSTPIYDGDFSTLFDGFDFRSIRNLLNGDSTLAKKFKIRREKLEDIVHKQVLSEKFDALNPQGYFIKYKEEMAFLDYAKKIAPLNKEHIVRELYKRNSSKLIESANHIENLIQKTKNYWDAKRILGSILNVHINRVKIAMDTYAAIEVYANATDSELKDLSGNKFPQFKYIRDNFMKPSFDSAKKVNMNLAEIIFTTSVIAIAEDGLINTSSAGSDGDIGGIGYYAAKHMRNIGFNPFQYVTYQIAMDNPYGSLTLRQVVDDYLQGSDKTPVVVNISGPRKNYFRDLLAFEENLRQGEIKDANNLYSKISFGPFVNNYSKFDQLAKDIYGISLREVLKSDDDKKSFAAKFNGIIDPRAIPETSTFLTQSIWTNYASSNLADSLHTNMDFYMLYNMGPTGGKRALNSLSALRNIITERLGGSYTGYQDFMVQNATDFRHLMKNNDSLKSQGMDNVVNNFGVRAYLLARNMVILHNLYFK